MFVRMTTAVCLSLLVAACQPKPMSIDKHRTVDIHARDGRAMVRNFEAQNGEKWMEHVAAHMKRCITPGMPEGTQVLYYSEPAGKRTGYLFALGVVAENGKIDAPKNLFYEAQFLLGSNSVVVLERGKPATPGVSAASGLTHGLASQLKSGLLPLTTCPGSA